MEWRPIQTAQKSATESVILYDGKRVFTGWYCEYDGWQCDQYADHCSNCDIPPTHWMPFPEPPQ